ncbi:MAG: RNA polymerase sigma factor [Gemmatimonadota bacterium]
MDVGRPGAEAGDRELVSAVLDGGDERAFRTLYRRYTPQLHRIALRLTEDREGVAEDVVHDTWVRAVERLSTFGWRSSLGTWLTGVLINRVREQWRAWGRVEWAPLERIAEPAVRAVAHEARVDLDRAITALPPGYRAAVVLHDVEGYSHEETARLLNIDVGTSKSQLSRARRRLREWLEPKEATP